LLTIIRKYKGFCVFFFAITFLIYAKGYSSAIPVEKDKTEPYSFIKAIAIITGSCQTHDQEQTTLAGSSFAKKVSIDRHLFRLVLIGIKHLQQINLQTCIIVASSPTVLDLNSILRL